MKKLIFLILAATAAAACSPSSARPVQPATSPIRSAVAIKSKGAPFGLRIRDDVISFCDDRGGRKIDPIAGTDTPFERECQPDGEPDTECAKLPMEVDVVLPKIMSCSGLFEARIEEPDANIAAIADEWCYAKNNEGCQDLSFDDENPSYQIASFDFVDDFKISGHVSDCASNGRVIAVAGSVVHLIDTITASDRTLESDGIPRRIAISADWVAWTNDTAVYAIAAASPTQSSPPVQPSTTSAMRTGMVIKTKGKPFGLRIEGNTASFCDERGGRKADLITGQDLPFKRACQADEPDHQCTKIPLNVSVTEPTIPSCESFGFAKRMKKPGANITAIANEWCTARAEVKCKNPLPPPDAKGKSQVDPFGYSIVTLPNKGSKKDFKIEGHIRDCAAHNTVVAIAGGYQIHLIDTKTATERTLDSIDRPDRIAISADWVAWTNESAEIVYAHQR